MDKDRDPKVSIVIPIYNSEAYVMKCLDSLANQTYTNIQVIVINDGSTDNSGKLACEYCKQDARYIYRQQGNLGVSSARNLGVSLADGEYLTFVDGDDYVASGYIENLVRCAQEHQAQMVITGLRMVDVDGNDIRSIIPGTYERGKHEEWTFRLSAVAAHLYERNLWTTYQMKFYEGERGEDMPVSLFFAGVCDRIATLSMDQYYYVQHSQSAMHQFRGLKKISLPYCALEQAIQKVQQVGLHNDEEFHELFVLRILATFIQLAKGADQQEIRKLSDYIQRILATYYPQYYKNCLTGIWNDLDIPFMQKVSVKVLIIVNRFKMVYPFLRFVCR